MSQKRQLLLAVVLFADFVALLCWMLRDTDERAVVLSRADDASAAMHADGSTPTKPDPRMAVDVGRAPVHADAVQGSKRTIAPLSASTLTELQGSIYGLDQRALTGLDVHVFARDGAGFVARTIAKPSASYSFGGLHPGKWTIVARSENYRDLHSSIDLRADEELHHFDLLLQREDELRVRLLAPDGRALAEHIDEAKLKLEVIPVATSDAPGARLSEALAREMTAISDQLYSGPATHADALKGFGSDVEGVLILRDPLPAFISAVVGDAVLQTKRAEADAEVVTFVLTIQDVRSALASVRLTLVDSQTGEFISGARVNLQRIEARSDDNGIVQFEGMLPGPHMFDVQCSGYESMRRGASLEPRRLNDLGVWPIDAWASITGRFRDDQGNPVSIHWSLAAQPSGTQPRSGVDAMEYFTGRSGLLKAGQIGRKKYWIRTNDQKWYGPPTTVDTSEGSVKDIEIQVSAGVPVTLRFGSGEDRYVGFAITSSADEPVLESGATGSTAKVCLGPGTYSVRYQIGEEAPAKKSFEVGPEAIDVELWR